ncbi:MAG: PDZ domain-containing protein [Saprospiraceae bacterium]
MNHQSIIRLFSCLLLLLSTVYVSAQVSARLFRYADVSQNYITFVYGGDIWVVAKEGGVASKLSSPAGEESAPKFSPDGQQIAFSGNYDGNTDVYVVPTLGGVPKRLTYHGMPDGVLDWTPDGKKLLFASSRESGRQRYSQFYTVPVNGGMAEKLPIAYGSFASYSPDGQQLAFTYTSRISRTWKRYRGGATADIWTFDLASKKAKLIIQDEANDELPMWHDNTVYFLSDRGPNKRYNLWSYDMKSGATQQLTNFKDYDVHFPSIGPADLVFEAGGKLYLMNLATSKYKEVKIEVVSDLASLAPRTVNVEEVMTGAWIAPDANRVVVEARGELFSIPAKDGYVKNLTNTSGVAERSPAWSPDGRYIAYWSDRSGEYELTLKDMKEKGTEEKISTYGAGFRYQLYWSPDSKKLVWAESNMQIRVYNLETKTTKNIDRGLDFFEGTLQGFEVNWSSDSHWVAYSRTAETGNSALFVYEVEADKLQQLTSGYYSDQNPTFDPEGKYLYFSTNRSFSPIYGDFDNSWTYPNATQLAAVALRKDVPSPLAPKNDEVEIKEEKKEDATSKKEEGEDKKKEEKKEDAEKKLVIDADGFEERIVLLPPPAGNYGRLAAVKGKLIFVHAPPSGSQGGSPTLKYFDFKEREEKTIISGVYNFLVAANGEKMLILQGGKLGIVDIAPGQKMETPLRTKEMEMTLTPKEEWQQIFNDTWRFERDFFYDTNMHGVDWTAMRKLYGDMVKDATTREDVNFIIGELIGELNASHTYRGGGDTESAKRKNVGYLGIDWALDNGRYKIAKIIKGAPWDAEVRSPLAMSGVDVKAGDYILSVNGRPLDANKEPFAAFEGLAGKTVALEVNAYTIADSARTIVVELMEDETRLRHLAWIEGNRKRVEEATNGQVGYVYVRSTGIDGQNELVRQFMAQYRKPGMIIDERFNSGGQIPDRFIELLNRPALAFWAVRDGQKWQWPPVAHFGPKAMLINGWSGSGGDAFPDYFRKSKLGPLIGSRTWGGLIGVSGSPGLVDGGYVTVPTFRMYDPDGQWFKEGYGVAPDIEVPEDPSGLAAGIDGQLERAIQEVLDGLKKEPKIGKQPAAEVRSK